MKSVQPGRQRKELYNAPMHKRRKWLASHLEENLLLKYDKRNIPVVKGDTVKVMRGSYKGHEDKVVAVNVKKRIVEIEGITITKADGKKIARPLHASNLLITKLNLTDKWRRKKLERGLSEETQKEIEKEAETQIKEQEEVRKQRELEEKQLEEAEEESAEPVEEEPIKEKTKKPVEKPSETKKPEEKVEKEKPEPKKIASEKKTPDKTKTTPKKKTSTKTKTAEKKKKEADK